MRQHDSDPSTFTLFSGSGTAANILASAFAMGLMFVVLRLLM